MMENQFKLTQIQSIFLSRKAIIIYIAAGLFFLSILLLIVSWTNKKNDDVQNVQHETVTPTVQQVTPASYIPLPSDAPKQQIDTLSYPFSYKGITVDFKAKSKVAVIFYNGSLEEAKRIYYELLSKSNVPFDEYKAEFFALDVPAPERTQSEFSEP